VEYQQYHDKTLDLKDADLLRRLGTQIGRETEDSQWMA
jgi:hypothetical protein